MAARAEELRRGLEVGVGHGIETPEGALARREVLRLEQLAVETPLALRAVWRIAQLKAIPVIAVGGIGTLDDVMEFLVVGATAVQVGTANFYDPTASVRIADALPEALKTLGASSVREVVGTMK